MSNQQLVMPTDVTLESLEQLFDEAYLDVSRDTDGDLYVEETFKIWVEPVREGQRIHIYTVFGVGKTSSHLDRLEYVNLINAELMLIRASLIGSKKDAISFDYYIFVEGGISKRAIVFALKNFASAVEAALEKDTYGAVN